MGPQCVVPRVRRWPVSRCVPRVSSRPGPRCLSVQPEQARCLVSLVGLPWEEPWGCTWLADRGRVTALTRGPPRSQSSARSLLRLSRRAAVTRRLLSAEVSSLHRGGTEVRGRASDGWLLCLSSVPLWLRGQAASHLRAPISFLWRRNRTLRPGTVSGTVSVRAAPGHSHDQGRRSPAHGAPVAPAVLGPQTSRGLPDP